MALRKIGVMLSCGASVKMKQKGLPGQKVVPQNPTMMDKSCLQYVKCCCKHCTGIWWLGSALLNLIKCLKLALCLKREATKSASYDLMKLDLPGCLELVGNTILSLEDPRLREGWHFQK